MDDDSGDHLQGGGGRGGGGGGEDVVLQQTAATDDDGGWMDVLYERAKNVILTHQGVSALSQVLADACHDNDDDNYHSSSLLSLRRLLTYGPMPLLELACYHNASYQVIAYLVQKQKEQQKQLEQQRRRWQQQQQEQQLAVENNNTRAVMMVGPWNRTPLMWACMNQAAYNVELMALLVYHFPSAVSIASTFTGRLPIHHVCYNMNYHGNRNACCSSGGSSSSNSGIVQVARLLLHHHPASCLLQDCNGKLPLELATMKIHHHQQSMNLASAGQGLIPYMSEVTNHAATDLLNELWTSTRKTPTLPWEVVCHVATFIHPIHQGDRNNNSNNGNIDEELSLTSAIAAIKLLLNNTQVQIMYHRSKSHA